MLFSEATLLASKAKINVFEKISNEAALKDSCWVKKKNYLMHYFAIFLPAVFYMYAL